MLLSLLEHDLLRLQLVVVLGLDMGYEVLIFEGRLTLFEGQHLGDHPSQFCRLLLSLIFDLA